MLVNVMEEAVKDMLPGVLHAYDCCKCEKCQQDVIAYALNHLPPRYVVRTSGAVLTRFNLSREQEKADVISALVNAITMITKNPKHNI